MSEKYEPLTFQKAIELWGRWPLGEHTIAESVAKLLVRVDRAARGQAECEIVENDERWARTFNDPLGLLSHAEKALANLRAATEELLKEIQPEPGSYRFPSERGLHKIRLALNQARADEEAV